MAICRSASTTKVPVGRTATTRPVNIVLNAVLDVACAFPASTCEDVGENRLATPLVLICPPSAVIPELAEKLRFVATLPVLVEERFCDTLIVTRSPTRDAL